MEAAPASLVLAARESTWASVQRLPDIPLPEIVEHIARYLPTNHVVFGLKLVNKATAGQFRAFRVAKLSEPSPHDAFCARWVSSGALANISHEKRRLLLTLTGTSGCLDNLEAAIAVVGLKPFPELAMSAASAGHLHIVEWLWLRGWPVGEALSTAAISGHRAICSWYLAHDLAITRKDAEAAAQGGLTDLMFHMMDRLRFTPGFDMVRAAAAGCDLDTLKCVYRSWRDAFAVSLFDVTLLLIAAASSPNRDWRAKVEWLESQDIPHGSGRHPRDPEVCSAVLKARPTDGHERVKWLQSRGYPLDMRAFMTAALSGSLAALEYLLDQAAKGHVSEWTGSPGDRTPYIAAEAGDLAFLRALHAHGCSVYPRSTGLAAARGGHLAVLAWLVETFGCQAAGTAAGHVVLDFRLFNEAVKAGDVELLAWLRSQGCQWDESAFTKALDKGCEEVAVWLADNGCPMPDNGMPYVVAAYRNDEAQLRGLHQAGRPWGPDATFSRILRPELDRPQRLADRLPVLRWLLANGCPVNWEDELTRVRRASEFNPAASQVEAMLREERSLRQLEAMLRHEYERRRVEAMLRHRRDRRHPPLSLPLSLPLPKALAGVLGRLGPHDELARYIKEMLDMPLAH